MKKKTSTTVTHVYNNEPHIQLNIQLTIEFLKRFVFCIINKTQKNIKRVLKKSLRHPIFNSSVLCKNKLKKRHFKSKVRKTLKNFSRIPVYLLN